MVHQIVVISFMKLGWYESHPVGVYQNHPNSQIRIALLSRLVRLCLE